MIATHGASADHFATFADNLSKEGYEIQIHASCPALKKFEERKIKVIHPFQIENLSEGQKEQVALEIAKKCHHASVILVDVGDFFESTLEKVFTRELPQVKRIAYYDNPEPYVPGGYSKTASAVMQGANKTLFANANLTHVTLFQEENVPIDIPYENRIGLGYYPVEQAEKLALRRLTEHQELRARLLPRDSAAKKVMVYLGGNNVDYFENAFPAFLSFLTQAMQTEDLSSFAIILQQHPAAVSKRIDSAAVDAWNAQNAANPRSPKLLISNLKSEDSLVAADGVLYYQTSMGPQMVLAGIPVAQVGHKTFADVLVRGHLAPSLTNPTDMVKELRSMKASPVTDAQKLAIYKSLGINANWLSILKSALSGK
jgi:hypothetical protein